MNRRTLLKSTLGLYAYTRIAPSVFAQNSEARWDEASQLYGNAWDVLPRAADGEIAIVTSGFATESSLFGSNQIFGGVIHNNTDEPAVLLKIDIPGVAERTQLVLTQSTVQPHGYGLVKGIIEADSELTIDPTTITPLFVAPDKVSDALEDDHFKTIHPESVYQTLPVQINAFERTGTSDWTENFSANMTNPTTDKEMDSLAEGIIIWFDTEGKLVIEEGFTAKWSDDYEPLVSGETWDKVLSLDLRHVDATSLFLVGMRIATYPG
ncbi:MAG: hypothetical protein KC435_10190 [Thermomicrobiales bacterium]|nr:hypothetical protein [Thermomicrobiales bacterium]